MRCVASFPIDQAKLPSSLCRNDQAAVASAARESAPTATKK